MSKRSFRFTALAGWIGHPTTDGRVWRGTVQLRGAPLPLRGMVDGHDGSPLLGRIHGLHTSGQAVWLSGRATAEIAEALNDGSLMLQVDLDPGQTEQVGDQLVFTNVTIAGAVAGDPELFCWRERP